MPAIKSAYIGYSVQATASTSAGPPAGVFSAGFLKSHITHHDEINWLSQLESRDYRSDLLIDLDTVAAERSLDKTGN